VRKHPRLGGTKMQREPQTSSQKRYNSGIHKRLSVGKHICEFDPFDYGTNFFGEVITTCQTCGKCVNRGFLE
jgi:hypothetical protein